MVEQNDILEELKLMADMWDDHEDQEMSVFFVRCIGEIRKLRATLEDANDMCRSALQVVERRGRQTGWDSLNIALSKSLERQHAVMHPETKSLREVVRVAVCDSRKKDAIAELSRYFISSNNVPVDQATILAEDFWRITGMTPNT